MKSIVIPLPALAAATNSFVTEINHDPLGGHNGPVINTANARNTTKANSVCGGIAGFNPD